MFVMILTQSHIIKFKVFEKHIKLSGLYLFKQDTLDVLTSHNCLYNSYNAPLVMFS